MAKKRAAKKTVKKVSRRAAGAAKKSASRKTTPDFLQVAGERWPMERNVLFRPERLQYVRKLVPEVGCVFCRCAETEPKFETLCVYQSKHSMVVLNKFPYNSGHILVVPKRHVGQIFDLQDEEYFDLMNLVRLAARVVEGAYQPAGFNLGMNHGKVSGAGIPEHLHYHIVPRWAGDLNFFPLIAETKVVIENLESSFDRLRMSFQNLGLEPIPKPGGG